MKCFTPVTIGVLNPFTGLYEPTQVPCGKCEACQHNRTVEWVQRIQDEFQFSRNGVFLTLTYNDENLPQYVNKEDVQKFFKRLRKRCEPSSIKGLHNSRYRPLRYFLTSEYGPLHNRPHYHAIVMDIIPIEDNYPDIRKLYEVLEKSWGLGFIYVEPITVGNCHYVVDYMVKDFHEDLPYELKQTLFNLKSNGLGLKFISDEQNKFNLGNRSDFRIPSESGKRNMPRYYKEKLFGDERRKIISYNNRRLQEHSRYLDEVAAGGREEYLRQEREKQIAYTDEQVRKRRLRKAGVRYK